MESDLKSQIKSSNKKIEFNEPDKSVTKILLLELRNIKKSLIESSKDIEKVFKLPLSHVRIDVSKINIIAFMILLILISFLIFYIHVFLFN